jgi:deazaflavin-dependent oxidoreductase (nitroreductase family)
MSNHDWMDNLDYREFNRNLIAEFRANGGRLSGPLAGEQLILLTTTGAKSGQPRTTPIAYTEDNGRLVIIASKEGSPNHPDWFHNLLANPEVTVELGAERFSARASVVAEEERQRLFDQMAAQIPDFARYQEKTTRQIPVVILERIEA